jgi:hypothetical protein
MLMEVSADAGPRDQPQVEGSLETRARGNKIARGLIRKEKLIKLSSEHLREVKDFVCLCNIETAGLY